MKVGTVESEYQDYFGNESIDIDEESLKKSLFPEFSLAADTPE